MKKKRKERGARAGNGGGHARRLDASMLPPGVSASKEFLPDGAIYTFRHGTLGLIGRIVIQPAPSGLAHVSAEVAGDPADTMTERRRALLGPIVELVSGVLPDAPEGAHIGPAPRTPAPKGEMLPTELVQCERCGQLVAVLVFGDEVHGVADFADLRRKFYPKLARWNVPAWIIGPPRGKGDDLAAEVRRIWPEEQSLGAMTLEKFRRLVDQFLNRHQGEAACKSNKYRSAEQELLEQLEELHGQVQTTQGTLPDEGNALLARAMEMIQGAIGQCIVADISMQAIEPVLFTQMLGCHCAARGLPDTTLLRLAGQGEQLIPSLIQFLKDVVTDLRDEGQLPQMTALRDRLDLAKNLLARTMASADLPEEGFRRQAAQATERIAPLTRQFERSGIPPALAELAFLYHWIRVSTFAANISESFFQTIERNFDEVAERVGSFLEEWTERR